MKLLKHPNIVTLYHHFFSEPESVLVLDLFPYLLEW